MARSEREAKTRGNESEPEPTPAAPAPASAPAGRRGGGLRVSLLLIVATIALVLLAQQTLRMLPDWINPFDEKPKDRSGPVLLQSIRDLSRYEAASGNFQVIVDLEKDAKFLPSAVRGSRTLFVGHGSVDAYVDFSKIADGAITVNADRTAVTVRLPKAQLEPTNLDTQKSYVFSAQRGLINRFGDFFGNNPNNQQQLYVLAAQKIQTAANESGLPGRADRNTRQMMEQLLKSLGFKTVKVEPATQ
ncbi:DUF4230 domain-containing protein [Actinomadura rudentiformis]|uniref:DUF4230 domain-containing protein n=1 Tax=Actinomadura rudentiformis TaxID=359158 RepID=A0A6H9YXQ1_9ACTN|nr:DUF4230 domain-containing protein [Actinomadura rudentiformis]KAB2345987.1 DUF4230 domain-containing protein [Actinomadura rudentiformis]